MSDFSEVFALAADLSNVNTTDNVGRAVSATTLAHHRNAVQSAPVKTGALKASITMQMETPLSGKVWSDLRQGFFAEFGTSVMAPQPWNLIHSASSQRELESNVLQALGRVPW